MSELSIFEKSQEIRFETQQYANTRERVANVLDDINDTKANKEDVAAAIQAVLDELGLTEQELYAYIDEIKLDLDKKMDKPFWAGYEQHYFVISSNGTSNLRPITLAANQLPYWAGNTFFNSNIYTTSGGNIGIATSAPTERFEVNGNVKANAIYLPVNSTSPVAYKLRSDGSSLYYTNGSNVERKLAFKDEIFEHSVRGKRVEATVNGTYAIDLNVGSHFVLVMTANTTFSFSNMIKADETCVITVYISGNFTETLMTSYAEPYNDVTDISKTRKYVFHIERGGASPIIRYTLVNL